MTKFNIKETIPSNVPAAKPTVTVQKMKEKLYCQYNTSYFFNCLIDFTCMTNGISIYKFLKIKEKISKSSFLHCYNKSGLTEYKKQGVFDAKNIAKTMLTNYFEKTQKTAKKEWQLYKIAVTILQKMRSIP